MNSVYLMQRFKKNSGSKLIIHCFVCKCKRNSKNIFLSIRSIRISHHSRIHEKEVDSWSSWKEGGSYWNAGGGVEGGSGGAEGWTPYCTRLWSEGFGPYMCWNPSYCGCIEKPWFESGKERNKIKNPRTTKKLSSHVFGKLMVSIGFY